MMGDVQLPAITTISPAKHWQLVTLLTPTSENAHLAGTQRTTQPPIRHWHLFSLLSQTCNNAHFEWQARQQAHMAITCSCDTNMLTYTQSDIGFVQWDLLLRHLDRHVAQNIARFAGLQADR